jgi:hypothetical protein
MVCLVPAYGQPYPSTPSLPGHASYYRADFNGFYDFLNGVWSGVYQWDPGQETTGPGGNVIGGYKQFYQDNLVFDHYTEYGSFWEGFTVSERDYEYANPDPLNQFSAVTRGGKDGPGTPFIIGYYGLNPARPASCKIWMDDGAPCEVAGMYVTNSSYAYLSMMKGDGFAHAFRQGDWFLLTAYGFDQDGRQTSQAEFYLADFRSTNAANHYIIKDWRWFDLLPLGRVASIQFVLSSSDYSAYGMNTPAYFCMDKLTLSLLSIKKQPQHKTVCAGQKAELSVTAVGYDFLNPVFNDFLPRYQWRKDGVAISGANDSVLIIPAMQEADAGVYSCVITSNYHTQQYSGIYKDPAYVTTVTSDNAQVSVGLPIAITQQPAGQSVDAGQAVSFSVAVSRTPNSYQWFRNGLSLPGSNSATLSIANAKAADAGEYHCVIKSDCADLTSSKALLKVKGVITDTVERPIQWVAYPNPVAAGQAVTLRGYDGYQCRLCTADGKVLQRFKVYGHAFRFYVPYRAGMYFLHADKVVTDANGNKRTIFNYEKVFVQ